MTQTFEALSTNNSVNDDRPRGLHPLNKHGNDTLAQTDMAGEKDHIVTIDIVDGEVNTVLFEPDSAAYRTISQTLGAVSIGKVL